MNFYTGAGAIKSLVKYNMKYYEINTVETRYLGGILTGIDKRKNTLIINVLIRFQLQIYLLFSATIKSE
ncbi:MAG TPA: hypothetical protein VK668_01890 [Mucilaginibacter sp.]|nr:hypothetical protein [Mucilaginibacter sp.]